MKPIFLVLCLILLSASFALPCKKSKHKPCKQSVFYFHDIIYDGKNAANATSAIVAAREGFNRTVLSDQFRYGTSWSSMIPSLLSLDHNLRSTPVGRAQGLYLYDGKNAFAAWLGFSFVFNNTDYQGTLNFIGADLMMYNTRDVSVVGGTGDFFMHRGIATIMTDAIEATVYFRLRVDINFFEC